MGAELENIGGYLTSYIRIIDIILGLSIVWGGYKGYKRGFLLELISILIFVTGVLLFFFLITQAFSFTKGTISSNSIKTSSFLFYIVFYLVGSMLLSILGKRLARMINYSLLDEFDNFVGLIIGVVKYAMFLAILIGLLDTVGFHLPEAVIKDSHVYPLLLTFQYWLIDAGAIVAPFVRDMTDEMYDLLQKDPAKRFMK